MYNVRHIAMKIPVAKANCENILTLITEIKKYASENRITINTYTIDELKKFWRPNGLENKKAVMKVIFGKYPELEIEFNREMKNRSKHYEKLFEAVGVAHMTLQNTQVK